MIAGGFFTFSAAKQQYFLFESFFSLSRVTTTSMIFCSIYLPLFQPQSQCTPCFLPYVESPGRQDQRGVASKAALKKPHPFVNSISWVGHRACMERQVGLLSFLL